MRHPCQVCGGIVKDKPDAGSQAQSDQKIGTLYDPKLAHPDVVRFYVED
jgi:hypothetical protein